MTSSGKSLGREKKTIAAMIEIYCRANHTAPSGQLCADCQQLLRYAEQRIDDCPFGADKGPCSKCEIHCYKPEMREKVIAVMRFSGPRMLKAHPILAADHLLKKWKKK